MSGDRGSRTTSRRLALAAITGTATGLVVTLVGVHAYSLLARMNIRALANVPWAPVLSIPLLWLYWRYLGGAGWPQRTSAYRARMRRANPVSRRDLPLIALTCMVGTAFVLAAMLFGFRLSDLPPDALRILPPGAQLPWWTAIPALVMLAVVAGVAEEVGLRGYTQGALEEAGHPRLAILLSAVVFTLLHADKAWFAQQAVPMLAAATWYGYLTYATQSVYPMIAVHTALDLVLFARYTILGAALPPSIQSTGLDTRLVVHAADVVVLGVTAFGLTRALAVRRGAHPGRMTVSRDEWRDPRQ